MSTSSTEPDINTLDLNKFFSHYNTTAQNLLQLQKTSQLYCTCFIEKFNY